MKYLKLLGLLLFASAFLLTSCDPDNIDTIDEIEEIETKVTNNIINALVVNNEEGLDLGCIVVTYPFQLETESGEYIDINSEEDFIAALENEEVIVVEFVYPLDVTDEEGEVTTVDNLDELGELFASCIPDDGWGGNAFPAFLVSIDQGDCYDFSYPMDLVDLDDNLVTINNQEEFVDAIATNDLLFFTFPLTLVDVNGVDTVVVDEEGLFTAIYSCYDNTDCDSIFWGGSFGCYQFTFPISFVMDDGSIETVNNIDEFNVLLLGGNVVAFSYPLTLLDQDGETLVINSDEEMEQALTDCGGGGSGTPIDPLFARLFEGEATCYNVNFPLTGTDVDGGAVVMNNFDEAFMGLFEGVTLDVPVTVTDLSGNILTINSEEDLDAILDNC